MKIWSEFSISLWVSGRVYSDWRFVCLCAKSEIRYKMIARPENRFTLLDHFFNAARRTWCIENDVRHVRNRFSVEENRISSVCNLKSVMPAIPCELSYVTNITHGIIEHMVWKHIIGDSDSESELMFH